MILQLVESVLRLSTPLLFAALGGLLCERSGVINIALEGLMLVGAFAASAVAQMALAHGAGAAWAPWIGLGGAVGAGVALAAIYGLFVVTFRADQIVAGTGINMLAAGITPFLCKILYGSSSATPSLPVEARFSFEPVAGAWLLLVGVFLFLKSTALGRWIRFAGEKPEIGRAHV